MSGPSGQRSTLPSGLCPTVRPRCSSACPCNNDSSRRIGCCASGERYAGGPRRAFLDAVVRDVCDGAHSFGELDFGGLCRRRGLPQPSRQVVRTLSGGRVYLDVAWEEVGLVVEIDGGHHALALGPVDDAPRQNDVVLSGERVLRIPVLGLRLTPDAFLDQVVRAHALAREAAA